MIDLEIGAKEVVLPPGAYIIGDPCYNVPEEQWDRVLDESGFFAMGGPGTGPNSQCWSRFKTFRGDEGTVVAFSTKYGDGTYKDYQLREYGVDAGLIGIIPLADIDANELDVSCAHVVKFDAPVVCYESKGMITFGTVAINTDDEELDDDHDDFWNEED